MFSGTAQVAGVGVAWIVLQSAQYLAFRRQVRNLTEKNRPCHLGGIVGRALS